MTPISLLPTLTPAMLPMVAWQPWESRENQPQRAVMRSQITQSQITQGQITRHQATQSQATRSQRAQHQIARSRITQGQGRP